jgi:ABC-type antimicrobial peptide transport system permease subunit
LKIAFRNLWKYRSRTFISIVGLAAGFACFAIATIWIRNEMTYDGFHTNADRLYRVDIEEDMGYSSNGLTNEISAPLPVYLKKTFPEINSATKILIKWLTSSITIDSVEYTANVLYTDSSFMNVFDIKIIEGNSDFLIPENRQVAITMEKARQLFGNETPIGKAFNEDYTIGAMIAGFSGHSNYPFDILLIGHTYLYHLTGDVVVELVPDIDINSFRKKLSKHNATFEYEIPYTPPRSGSVQIKKIDITPLTSIHYKDPNMLRTVKFQHIVVFAIAGALLILCTLFNYLTLFISRFRMRQREFALRKVWGASNSSLFMLLSVEFMISMIIASALGAWLIYVIMPFFRTLTEIQIEHSHLYIDIKPAAIYLESFIYTGIVIAISLLTFLLTLYIFGRKALNIAIHRGNRKMFRRISITVQLIISMGFTFCAIIILKQMYHLHNTDIGFEFKNRGEIFVSPVIVPATVLANQLQQIPEITETVVNFSHLSGARRNLSKETFDWEGRPGNVERMTVTVNRITMSENFAKFYGVKLLAGEMPTEADTKESVLINETAAKLFGWDNPVGKTFESNRKYTVKGVIKNIYNNSPTMPVEPAIYEWINGEKHPDHWITVLFKYREGTWKTCKEKIERTVKEKYPDSVDDVSISKEEDVYDDFLKSENALLKILTVVSLVCVIICIFGFVSMVSLTCEERRKEIAIRKINGATVKDILDIFFKEYLTLLVIGAAIAFIAGYIVMKQWLEQYVLQTEMSVWIYIAILFVMILAIVVCIGEKVWRTSRENPIDALKS